MLRLHRELIEHYGGAEGLRDRPLLESAVAMARATFDHRSLHPDLFAMASAYLFHIVGNHPFVDGNKRAGAAAALVFLAINDVSPVGDEIGLVAITLGVAEGRVAKSQVADFLKSLAL